MGDGRLLSTSDVNIMYKSYGYHPPIEPPIGIEPTTYWLQINCSTKWATAAGYILNYLVLSYQL